MQKRHQDRWLYFSELANTSREYYIDYVKQQVPLTPATKILEIGCGEGGNLLPFAEMGCSVMGIDINAGQIENAKAYFERMNQKGTFISGDFTQVLTPDDENDRFDIVLVHDVIEHIEPPFKIQFLQNMKKFMRKGAVAFIAFPAWQMPFGGHQQICRSKIAKIPFIHLLPTKAYQKLLRKSGIDEPQIDELLSIKRSRMPIERFEKVIRKAKLKIKKRTLWFINPHYKQKFKLMPIKEIFPFTHIPYLRNYYTTSAWYMLEDAE